MTNAHDKFVRTAMSDPRVAREFFSMHLPEDICSAIDFNHLKMQPRSYIDDVRKESTVDILYKTRLSGHESYLYLLLEHQSTPDELMPFRILKYICNIIDHHLKTTKKKSLPLVYPIVIYHAASPYPCSVDIRDIVEGPRRLIESYFLQPFHLIDLGRIEDTKLKNHTWAGVMEFALKHIFARDILPYLKDIAEILRGISESGGKDYVSLILQYLLERGELEDEEAFFGLIQKDISPDIGESVMTLAERLRIEGRVAGIAEGRAQGRAEGRVERDFEIAQYLLAQGAEAILVANATGLHLRDVEEMKKSFV